MTGDNAVYREPARDVPVIGTYDVVICGGGPAGGAAAVAAARCGVRTLLIEKEGYLGGVSVSGMVGVILSTNGVDFQGIWHEWARGLKERGGIVPLFRSPSHLYKDQVQWLRGSVDPEKVKCVWEDLCDRAGADILLHASVAGTIRHGEAVAGVLVETCNGRGAIHAERVVDATGDGMVAWQAGAEWFRPSDGKSWPQAVSLNGLWGVRDAWDKPMEETQGGRPERLRHISLKEVDPLDPWDLTRAHRTLRRHLHETASAAPAGVYLIGTATRLGVRASRAIRGVETIGDEDAWTFRKRFDAIARSSWEIDIHAPDEDAPPPRFYHSGSEEYRHRNRRTVAGEYFDIPYGCLVPRDLDNILVAGRCISAGQLAHGSLRIQQTCIATGQAAGTAAAMSLKAGTTPRQLPPSELIARLQADRADVEPAFDILSELPIAERA